MQSILEAALLDQPAVAPKFTAAVVLLTVFATAPAFAEDGFRALRDQNWPTWRGPRSDGIAIQGDPPTRWDEQTNVKWKVPLPGQGSGTPIVWQGRIYLTSAIETDDPAPAAPVHPDAKTRPPERLYEFVLSLPSCL